MIVLIRLMGCFRKVDRRLMSCLGLLMGHEGFRGWVVDDCMRRLGVRVRLCIKTRKRLGVLLFPLVYVLSIGDRGEMKGLGV